MTKRVLVTGGAGFIGSHLCDFLIARGYRVICVDNLITGRKDNIRHLLKDRRFTFIKHDVTKYISIKERLAYVLHFASPASPLGYMNLPIQTLKVGSLGTHNALGVAKSKQAGFLLASTSEVYGDPLVHPQPESYWGNVNCVGPRGVYDESKRFAEAITMAYHKTHKVNTKIVRIFNTFGPRMRSDDGRAVPNFICQALRNKPLTVYGNGIQTRSFCYITDLLEGIYRLMRSSTHSPVNMGNYKEMAVKKLAEKIIEFTGSKSRIVYRELPEDDPRVRRPDISLANNRLGWEPRVPLNEGIIKTIDWFKRHEL